MVRSRLKQIVIVLTLTLSLFSCKENTSKIEKELLTTALGQLGDISQYQWLIVLPGLGCHGCIQETEYFMKTHVNDKRILFVLTNTSSIKILEQKTEVNISEQPNIYVDRENLFQLPTGNTIYPCVIELKNGEMINFAFQSPQTSALYDLENKLKQ